MMSLPFPSYRQRQTTVPIGWNRQRTGNFYIGALIFLRIRVADVYGDVRARSARRFRQCICFANSELKSLAASSQEAVVV